MSHEGYSLVQMGALESVVRTLCFGTYFCQPSFLYFLLNDLELLFQTLPCEVWTLSQFRQKRNENFNVEAKLEV